MTTSVRFPIVVLALLLLTSLLSPFSGRATVQAQPAGSYIALGDSIAAGIGSSLPRVHGYAAIVAERYRHRFGAAALHENLAVPGETASTFISDGQLERFRGVVSNVTSAGIAVWAVSLSLGGNEMLALEGRSQVERQAGFEAFGPSYREALMAVRNELGPDIRIVVTTYYDLSDGDPRIQGSDAWWVTRFNQVIRQIATEAGATIADVAPVFAGGIAELTLYPVDVHPSNAGHHEIAQAVWAALGVDTSVPVISAPERLFATRSTPTLRFTASDDGEVVSASVSSDSVNISSPIEIAPGEFVTLVRLGDGEDTPDSVTITAVDDAGNRADQTVEITFDEANGEP